MACFVVPLAEAVVTTVVSHVLERNAKSNHVPNVSSNAHVPFFKKLKTLSNMLWGGSLLLAFEHAWHGEIEPWFPFLTATTDPASTHIMLQEMASVGTSMAALVTLIWGISVAISSVKAKNTQVVTVKGN